MDKKKTAVLLAVAAMLMLGVTGCKETKEPPKTVEWYMEPANKQALEERLQMCKNNPGQLKDDPDCINAFAAQRKIFINKPAPTGW
jgi:glutamine synthetase